MLTQQLDFFCENNKKSNQFFVKYGQIMLILISKYTIMIFIICNFDGFEMNEEATRLIAFKSLINLQDSIKVEEALFVGNYTKGFKLHLIVNNIRYVVSNTSVEPDAKRFFNIDRAIKNIQIKTNINKFTIQIKD